jgi:hypothetical protein
MVGSAVDKGFKKYSGNIDCNNTISTPEEINATNITINATSSVIRDCDIQVKLQVAMAVTLMVGLIQVSG